MGEDTTRMNNYKKSFFIITILLVVYAAIESVSFLAFVATERQLFSFSRMQAVKDAIVQQSNGTDAAKLGAGSYVAHPYWGYVRPNKKFRAKKFIANKRAHGHVRMLQDLDDEIPTRLDDTVNVLVLGGSVARMTGTHGWEQLIDELQNFDDIRGRNIVVYIGAQAAMKQPQQMTKLSYLLALGSEFDIIINLDGLNEVYVSVTRDNAGIFPFYPKIWSNLTRKLASSASTQLVAQITFERQLRIDLARLAEKSPFRFSITANTMWLYFDRYLSSHISQRLVELDEFKPANTYLAKGPKFPMKGHAPLDEEIADSWKRGSLGLRALSAEFGAEYFHFLQPNQYLPNSKPMDTTERKLAFHDGVLKVVVPRIYPLLIERSGELRSAGVNYFDLTMMFKDQKETRYIDNCCHLNRIGSQELAREIGRAIVNRLEEQKKSSTGKKRVVSSENQTIVDQ
jgi:hypothetical protein